MCILCAMVHMAHGDPLWMVWMIWIDWGYGLCMLVCVLAIYVRHVHSRGVIPSARHFATQCVAF